MGGPSPEEPDDPRSDWHDQDLLTNAEAAGRLDQEIAETRTKLDSVAGDDPRHDELVRRLNAMEEALRELRAG